MAGGKQICGIVILSIKRVELLLDKESFERVETTVGNLRSKYGYCDRCARDAVSYLWRRRYS